MSSFLHNKNDDKIELYYLKSTNQHQGYLDNGHYTALIRDTDKNSWTLFDDQLSYSEKNAKQMIANNGYILYF